MFGMETTLKDELKRTALYEEHVKLKARLIEFGDWLMPVFYSSVLSEHKTVREAVGLFDVSHMGEIRVKGSGALAFLQYLTINDVSKLNDGKGQYSAFCNEHGGMIDDLILYRLTSQDYFLCVNASNTSKDFAWVAKQAANFKNLSVQNESNAWSQIAVQGPLSPEALKRVFPKTDHAVIETLAYMQIIPLSFKGKSLLLARTGYTGEKGYELYLPNAIAAPLWQKLLSSCQDLGIQPIGLGARDTLRLEACYLLYGNDMDENVSPLEADIGWATKLGKGDFIGKAKLVEQKEQGSLRKLYAFKMLDNGIPRHGMSVLHHGESTGAVTSGSVLPTVGGAGGMALLSSNLDQGSEIEIDIRGKVKRAIITERPLYLARVK